MCARVSRVSRRAEGARTPRVTGPVLCGAAVSGMCVERASLIVWARVGYVRLRYASVQQGGSQTVNIDSAPLPEFHFLCECVITCARYREVSRRIPPFLRDFGMSEHW